MKKVLKIGLLGSSGRIGSGIIKLLENDDQSFIVQKISRQQLIDKDLFLEEVDVIIDFSLPEATCLLLKRLREKKISKPMMIGTTGFSQDQWNELHEYASTSPVIQTSNTSLSIGLICQFAKNAAVVLGKNYEILISEVHHKHKVDSPSGTAKMLAQSCIDGFSNPPYIQALRIGDVKGVHEITFFGPYDRITIRHEADDRQLFCEGAVTLAKWIVNQKPGQLHSIQDFLIRN
ncbi:MAG: hypothetical protein C0432_00800 [Candidatus Puniceispirillum sp.]|nr:hypothetical protein [Candidatus Pelagibacter sp.]MBA4282820.1 hypothetical protein [Candidatus Puniceispirillum sp.]